MGWRSSARPDRCLRDRVDASSVAASDRNHPSASCADGIKRWGSGWGWGWGCIWRRFRTDRDPSTVKGTQPVARSAAARRTAPPPTDPLAPAAEWFAGRGWEPFAFQREVWEAYLAGESGLIHAAT